MPNMQFANNGVGNDAGPAQTTLTSTNGTLTLFLNNTGNGRGLSARGGVNAEGLGGPAGVFGLNRATGNGVSGRSQSLHGVQGQAESQAAAGVYGENLSQGGSGVFGLSNSIQLLPGLPGFGAAVRGDNTLGGWAGHFTGPVRVTGFLVKSGGGFQIDHPVDPANSYLNHSFVESPDMMNVYNGNVTSDAEGNATVELPGYFEALNRDFRYQLTALGQFAQAIVAEEVKDNSFTIKTDKPNVRVSWQVTGIRQDAWANAHRTEAEVEKSEGERGKYLSPTEHDQPATAGIYSEVLPASDETELGSITET
jgi:hypothetical protein